jgi:hypothetical protein
VSSKNVTPPFMAEIEEETCVMALAMIFVYNSKIKKEEGNLNFQG